MQLRKITGERGSQRLVTALLSAGALAGGSILAVGPGASTPAGASTGPTWAPTGTKALPMTNATALGAAPASTPLTVSVALSARNRAGLAALARSTSTPGSSNFGHFLTPSEVAARFAPSAAQASAVAAWLRQEGFSNVTVEADRLLVTGTADAGVVQSTFDTRLGLFRFVGHTVYANTRPAMVPGRFGGLVLSVLGLSDVPMRFPLQRRSDTATIPAVVRQQIAKLSATAPPDTSGFTPEQLARIYDASAMASATRTSVAVVVSGDMTSTIADLRYAEAQNHAAAAPVSVVYAAPKSAVTYKNPYTGNLEWDLDTQMSTQIAGNVSHEYLYDMASLDDADVSRAINLFFEQDKALAGSASLGECDIQPWLDGSMVATDQVLEEGALQGQSFFASSGDNGFACPEVASTGVPGGVPGASWPADGTWTTAVGGTSLLATASGQYEEELSWIGGGGGISEVESPGNWTAIANPAGQGAQYLPAGGRGEPDIAADADPNVSPVIVWQNKAKNYVGGTSVSSPLSLGLWARLQTAHGNRLGLASIDFYKLYNVVNSTGAAPVEPAGFHDIVLGTNGFWTALPGYDFTTGIGSFETGVLNRKIG
ncbi:MAG: S53 family peptidase [Acidimicrobiales bacterium]